MAILKKTKAPVLEWETVGLSHFNSFAAGQSQTGQFGVDDVLSGGRGNDWLYGLGGDDMLFGDGGNDTLHGGAGADTMFGGNGIDTVSYVYSPSAVTVGLNTHEGIGGDAEGDQIWEFENVIGSDGDDWLYGDEAGNFMQGGKGEDYVRGFSGDDFLEGGAGVDLLNGDDGNDVLNGGDGADKMWGGNADDLMHGGKAGDHLYGNEGDDVLDGGLGADVLSGGGGVDTFVFYVNQSDVLDVIDGFDPLEDILQLHGVSDANDPDVQVITNEDGFTQLNFAGGGRVVLADAALGNVTSLAQLDAKVDIEYVA
jgi:Ca2+-binding RTX toxin-like protein